jgi:hypothetical protein
MPKKIFFFHWIHTRILSDQIRSCNCLLADIGKNEFKNLDKYILNSCLITFWSLKTFLKPRIRPSFCDRVKEGVGLVVHFPLQDIAKINTP